MEDSNNPLKLFIELANFDQSLNQLRQQIKTLASEKEFLQTNYANLATKLESIKKKVHDAQKAVHGHELVMKDLDSQLQKQKQFLEQNINQKEYTVIKNSITNIKQNQYDYEPILIEDWNKLELAQKELIIEQEGLVKAESELELNLNQKSLQATKIELDLAQQMELRKKLLINIPGEWLSQYDALYTKISNPIVELQQGACSGCFEPVTAQVAIELKRHKMLQCRSCHRFLFI